LRKQVREDLSLLSSVRGTMFQSGYMIPFGYVIGRSAGSSCSVRAESGYSRQMGSHTAVFCSRTMFQSEHMILFQYVIGCGFCVSRCDPGRFRAHRAIIRFENQCSNRTYDTFMVCIKADLMFGARLDNRCNRARNRGKNTRSRLKGREWRGMKVPIGAPSSSRSSLLPSPPR